MDKLYEIGLIADDFTGAMDSGAQFANSAISINLRFDGTPDAEVEIVNTGSREVALDVAVSRVTAVCRLLKNRKLYKKIDSTMRGHIAAEINAVLKASAYTRAVICPAIPKLGRVVRNGCLFVNDVPLEQTAFKYDPVYPALTSCMTELLGCPVSYIPLEVVRTSETDLVNRIVTSSEALVIVDAETDFDLQVIARAIEASGALPCGALGLAHAYMQALRMPSAPKQEFKLEEGLRLVVVGSANKISLQQIDLLENRKDVITVRLDAKIEPFLQKTYGILRLLKPSHRVLVLCAEQTETLLTPDWLNFGKKVSEIGLHIIRELPVEAVLIIGGETALHFGEIATLESIQILGEAVPGVPYGRIRGGRLDGQLLISKAGGFGNADMLEQILF
ncbi:MAG: hypothetical protein CVU39_14360 [Chloroflexi bacterium HGW-Chloroflexi-10]|nr:MAG: hypothetical protein CVU39_14360 [Chloroflexi bacterium HGW-Chloroflexi-10]